MVKGYHKKATKIYFHCRSLKSRRGKIESIVKNLDIETEKKLKLYLSYFH